jgi:hypothetical protein
MTELPAGLKLCACGRGTFRPSKGERACKRCPAPVEAPAPKPVEFGTVRVLVPFMPELSKNQSHVPIGLGRLIRGKASAAAKAELAEIFRRALDGRVPVKAKLRVDIMVYMPNHRMDAGNFVDVTLDALQLATGLNDRWYSGSWDWEIDPANPRLEIEISQEGKRDA